MSLITSTTSNERFHFILSISSSIIIFGASFIAYQLDAYETFATVSVYLTISMIISTIIQFGADHNLPQTALHSREKLNTIFSFHIVICIIFSILIFIVSLIFSNIFGGQNNFSFIPILLGCVTGFQLIADSLLRAKSALLKLGILHFSINLLILVSVIILMLFNNSNAIIYVYCLIIAKFVFFLAVVICDYSGSKITVEDMMNTCLRLPAGAIIAAICILCGTLDIILIAFFAEGEEAQNYISIKYFAYGIYLALVNEALLPTLISRFVNSSSIILKSFFLYTMFLSLTIGLLTLFVCELIIYIKEGEFYYSDSPLQIAVGITLHTFSMLSLKMYFIVYKPCFKTIIRSFFRVSMIISITLFVLIEYSDNTIEVNYICYLWGLLNLLMTLEVFAVITRNKTKRN